MACIEFYNKQEDLKVHKSSYEAEGKKLFIELRKQSIAPLMVELLRSYQSQNKSEAKPDE